MAEFQVTASTLKQKAEELRSLNGNFEKAVQDLVAAHQKLNGMWEGDSRQAFDTAFTGDKGKMDNFKYGIDEYYARLLTIIAEYERTESINVNTANTRK